ncbi:MAG: hypothetical protein CV087_22900 [Candidatus Brocadia sp. WS118]|nr:MAG: hypothetical protein CV087_22900 [Candidatus Brocadia sp. WS118]
MNFFITEDNSAESKLLERCNGIHAAMRVLAESTTSNEVIAKILQTICESLEWTLGEFWITDSKNSVLRCEEVWHKPSVNIPEYKTMARQIAFPPGVGLPGMVCTSKKPVWIDDIAHNTNLHHTKIVAKEGFHGALGIPIIHENEIMGVFVFFSKEIQPANEDLLIILASTGRLIGQFIKKKQADNILHQTYKDLELKIKKRTAALVQANKRLQIKIVEHKQAEDALTASESRYRGLFENSPVSLWEEDSSEVKTYIDHLRATGINDFKTYFENHPEEIHKCVAMVRVVDVNQATLKMYQATSKEQLLIGLTHIFDKEAFAVYRQALIVLAEGQTIFEAEATTRTFRGAKKYVHLRLSIAPGHEHTWAKIFVSLTDITTRKQTENALKRRIDFEKTVASISTKFLVISDFNKAVFKSLAEAGQLSKASRAYLFRFHDSGNILDNTHEWCNEGIIPKIQHCHNLSSAMRPWLMENLHAGNIIHIADVSKMPPEAAAEKEEFEKDGVKALLILPVYAENDLAGFIGFDNIVTIGPWHEEDIARLRIMAEIVGNAIARKKSEALITHMAYHDPLTNLPNRNLFQDRLGVAIVHAKRTRTIMAVMVIDLDNFKTINDSLGHYTGDLLLLAVAERLKKCVRESDTIARTGGDEFIIVLPEITYPLNAAIVANKILDTLSKPFWLEGHELYTTVSIGISLYPVDTDDVSSLIKNADVAMYLSKEQGKNTYRFYKSDMNTHV